MKIISFGFKIQNYVSKNDFFIVKQKRIPIPLLFNFMYSVVSIKRTGCNKRTGWSKNLVYYMKKRSGW